MNKEELTICTEYYNFVFPDECHRDYNVAYADPLGRSKAHNELAKLFDVDRDLIVELSERISTKFGCDSTSMRFNHKLAYKEFINGMDKLRSLPESERHRRIVLTDEAVKQLQQLKGINL